MGWNTDRQIAEFQERVGIKLPDAEERAWISRAQEAAISFYEVLILDESGIRDGDGTWHGSDAVDGTLDRLVTLLHERREARPL